MFRILLCLGLLSPILSFSITKQCRRNDAACIEELANAVAKYLNPGVPELGIERLDPLLIEMQEGSVASLDYKFINRTVGGLNNCHIGKLKLNPELTNIQYQLDCRDLRQVGKYVLEGQLLIIPVHGEGNFVMTAVSLYFTNTTNIKYYLTSEFHRYREKIAVIMMITVSEGRYLINSNVDLKKTKGSDGKTYVTLKNFRMKYEPTEPLIFDFENLFNGQKELSEAIHNFAHENWRDLAAVMEEPVMQPVWERILKNVNKFLKTFPVEDILID